MFSDEKRQLGLLDGTPEKRLFWSIISDYDTSTALCELIDNAVDCWWPSQGTTELRVAVQLDLERQLIFVEDNAGGVPEKDLRYLIAPGGSNNDPNAEKIGVFGVGSKRSAMALAENITIKTRQSGETAFQIDITKDWVESHGWDIPVYEVGNVPESSTVVSMSALRRVVTQEILNDLRTHLAVVYGTFLHSGKFDLILNGSRIPGVLLENWAYPKEHEPRRVAFEIDVPGEGTVRAAITAGLVHDRDPTEENYGVCFYCNGRLIAKDLKSREVGYVSGSGAGIPHPDASLARVIVTLAGPAKLMPWNSSKTGINYSHPVFLAIHPLMEPLLAHFSSLSRRLKHRWEQDVLNRREGKIVDIESEEAIQGARVHLPPLPRVQKSRAEQLLVQNKKIIDEQPWTLGLVEAVAAVDIVGRQRLLTKNRLSLILLDSGFEIALKEFIVHRQDLFPKSKFGDRELADLFKNREAVIEAVDAKVQITPALLSRARHYYGIRNKLIHERATVEVLDADIRNYRLAVQQILQLLFGLNLGSA